MPNISPAVAALIPKLGTGEADLVASALLFVRRHLKMDVAFLAEFKADHDRLIAVEGYDFNGIFSVGAKVSLPHGVLQNVCEGKLPQLIPDIEKCVGLGPLALTVHEEAQAMLTIPVHRLDGTVFGVFCCLSRFPQPGLNERDLEVARTFTSLAADQIRTQVEREFENETKRKAIETVLKTHAFQIALQPIMRLQDQGTAGYEALCRFSSEPYRPPNRWFDDAAEVGLQLELELHVIEVALGILKDLGPECYLAVNTSPATLASGKLTPVIEAAGGDRVVIEITEHNAIENLDALLIEIDRLRELGARIAIDDAGAGYSGLQQIIRLRPNVIKLDMSLTKDVDKDLARRSLASAMVQFAQDTNAAVVAEGIETEEELLTLKKLGVEMGQGYHLGKPALAVEVLQTARSA